MDYLENGFKIRRWKQCVGSSPTTGTIPNAVRVFPPYARFSLSAVP